MAKPKDRAASAVINRRRQRLWKGFWPFKEVTLQERLMLMEKYGLRLKMSELFGNEPGQSAVPYRKDFVPSKRGGLCPRKALAECRKKKLPAEQAARGICAWPNKKSHSEEFMRRVAREAYLACLGKARKDRGPAIREVASRNGVKPTLVYSWMARGFHLGEG